MPPDPYHARLHRSRLLAGVLLLLLVAGGCADFMKPRLRAGSVPRPGRLTLYTVVDPDAMGTHRYAGLDAPFVERTRGLVYTERAGLLDIAHVRMTIDWTWHYYERVRHALAEGDAQAGSDDWLVLDTSKPTRIHLQFNHDLLVDDQGDRLHDAALDELAFRIGQQVAWHLGVWHEMAQWHGYRSTGIFSELDSAFTHDDTTSHLVGLYVVERAWRQRHDAEFDDAVTAALDELLREFGALTPAQTRDRVEWMRGRWWDGSGVLRRHIEPWMAQGELHPWLVADEPAGPGRWGQPMRLPDWDSSGVPLASFLTIHFEPNLWETAALMVSAGSDSPLLSPAHHFPRIKESIRHDLLATYGPDADQP
ncbi:MAG: DUF4056 domain-containing protein [Phycisphaeraceae bacterium]